MGGVCHPILEGANSERYDIRVVQAQSRYVSQPPWFWLSSIGDRNNSRQFRISFRTTTKTSSSNITSMSTRSHKATQLPERIEVAEPRTRSRGIRAFQVPREGGLQRHSISPNRRCPCCRRYYAQYLITYLFRARATFVPGCLELKCVEVIHIIYMTDMTDEYGLHGNTIALGESPRLAPPQAHNSCKASPTRFERSG